MTHQRGLLAAIGSFGGGVLSTLRDKRWARWTLNSVVFAAVSVSLVGRAQTYQQPTPPPVSPVVMAQPPSDINSIAAANLFGVYENGGKPGVLTRSSLNVVVTGLLAFGAPGGMATMSVDGKPETSFATGEEILPGVRLHAVENEHVIVSRNGQLEIVPLNEFAGSGSVTLVMASANNTAAMPASASPWTGQRGLTQLAANTASPDNQPSAPQSTEPQKQKLKQRGKNGGAGHGTKSSGTGTGATNGGPAGPQPVPAGTGNVSVPRPPAGGSAPQIPRPAPGAPVPEVPRPAPGAPAGGPPRPAQ